MARFKLFILVASILITASSAFGSEDGFGQAKMLSSKHFTVYYAKQLDTFSLANNLKITFSDRVLAGINPKAGSLSEQAELGESLDTLFLAVCSMLDMHLYSFQGKIKICRDMNHLGDVYSRLFSGSLEGRLSFYVANSNTIYIPQEHFQREILGHEIAHAIISNYFVVQPPVRASEILAGYVEYQLRKTDRK